METVLSGNFFFRAPAPAKFKLRKRKKIKKGKVRSWYKTGMNEVNTPVQKKRSSINFTDFLI